MNTIVKKSNGLRKSVAIGDHLPAPKVSRRVCVTHGDRFIYQESDNTWGCPRCDEGRVGLNAWYKETRSLGHIKSQVYYGSHPVEGVMEVVVTRTSTTPCYALIVQKIKHEEDTIVVVIDSLSLSFDGPWAKKPLDEDGVRWFSMRDLYKPSGTEKEATVVHEPVNVIDLNRNRIAISERMTEEIAKMPILRDLNVVVDYQ